MVWEWDVQRNYGNGKLGWGMVWEWGFRQWNREVCVEMVEDVDINIWILLSTVSGNIVGKTNSSVTCMCINLKPLFRRKSWKH